MRTNNIKSLSKLIYDKNEMHKYNNILDSLKFAI